MVEVYVFWVPETVWGVVFHMANEQEKTSPIELTSKIVSTYVGNNRVEVSELPALIRRVHTSLCEAMREKGASDGEKRPKPAVAVRDSIQPDYIVCLEDGRKLKTLKRHLGVKYGLTPEGYRARWNLPPDYPMVAPNYAKRRSELARRSGLGRKRQGDTD